MNTLSLFIASGVTESHPIEHAIQVYVGLLLLACIVGIVGKRFAHVPYTVFLTLVGLAIGIFHIGPDLQETGFSHDLIFFVFLPPLLFQGSLHMDVNRLLRQFWPIVCFAIPGVLVSTLLVGSLFGWLAGMGSAMMVAILFGALISPTDPVSVLALFREADAPENLKTLVEGESLFNDATGVVVFTILLEAIVNGEGLSAGNAIFTFVKVSLGGLVIGAGLGMLAFVALRGLNDHLLENAICLTLAYGAFWLAERFHCSGVIATVMAGLLIGNYGRTLSMSRKTTETVENFFESIDFLINSFLFILIGLELRMIPDDAPIATVRLVAAAIVAMLVGRAFVSYLFYWGLNQVGRQRPKAWKHVLFWGGLRGSIPIALLLHLPTAKSLPPDHLLVEYRPALIVAGLGCVFFSLVIQGMTMKPLLRRLGIGGGQGEPQTEESS